MKIWPFWDDALSAYTSQIIFKSPYFSLSKSLEISQSHVNAKFGKIGSNEEEPDGSIPKNINTPALRSLYDNLNNDEDLAIHIHEIVLSTRQDWFRWSKIKQRIMKSWIIETLKEEWINDINVDELFEIIKNQSEY